MTNSARQNFNQQGMDLDVSDESARRDSQSQGNFSTSQNSHTFEAENFEVIKAQSLRCEGGFVDVPAEFALRILALQASPHLVPGARNTPSCCGL